MTSAQMMFRSIAAMIGLAVAAALLVSLATGGGDRPKAAQSAASPGERSAATGRAAAAAEVALLRRPRVATRDVLPTGLLSGPLLADGALDVATTRRVTTGGEQVYVASSADGRQVCSLLDGGLGCTSVSSLLDEGTAPSVIWRSGEPFSVFGVAADGVTDIELIDLDDRAHPVTVTDGVYLVESDEWPKALTWEGASGSESFTFPDRA